MLIGLYGYPEAGKGVVAGYLARRYGFARVNVGDGMKAMLEGLYRMSGLDAVQIERRLFGDLKETPDPLLNGKTPRYALQTIGCEWRDLISPTLFSDRWADRVRTEENAVADGMRYPEELPSFRGLRGALVRVDRPGHRRVGSDHKADRQLMLDPPDAILLNDGNIPQLLDRVDRLLVSLIDVG